MADLVRAYSLARRQEDADRLMHELEDSPNRDTLLATSFAEAYEAVGRLDEAFAALDRDMPPEN